jgi:2-alkyl-3-oxoalkanoate reductase
MILVTGAAGFLGRHVSRVGGEELVALVHRPAPDLVARRVEVGDVCDPQVLDRALDGVSAVIHLAARNVDHDGQGYERVNVGGVRALLDAMHRKGVTRLLYVSSTGVYGHGRQAGSLESTPIAPDTPFSRSKAAAEGLILGAHAEGRVQATVLRHRFVYGEGDAAVLPRMHRAATRLPFLVDGGRARLSLIWAGDLARVAWRLASEPEPREEHPVYHVTDGQPVAYGELVRRLCTGLGGEAPRRSLPFGLVHGVLSLRERLLRLDPETASGATSLRVALIGRDNWFSDARLRARLPDWEPTPLDAGLDQSWTWYRSVQ